MSEPDGRSGEAVREADQSWLVRAVPALVLGVGLVAMAAAMVMAAQSGVSERASETLVLGPVEVLFVYTTPSATMIAAGVLTAVALVLLVYSVENLAARRITDPVRRFRQALKRPLREEATPANRSG